MAHDTVAQDLHKEMAFWLVVHIITIIIYMEMVICIVVLVPIIDMVVIIKILP